MKCRNCGKPIARCELGPDETTVCYFHPGNGWHRCDGKPGDPTAPEPAEAVAAP